MEVDQKTRHILSFWEELCLCNSNAGHTGRQWTDTTHSGLYCVRGSVVSSAWSPARGPLLAALLKMETAQPGSLRESTKGPALPRTTRYNKAVCGTVWRAWGEAQARKDVLHQRQLDLLPGPSGLRWEKTRHQKHLLFCVWSFPLLERPPARMIWCSVFHGESIIRTWLKHNPLLLQGPEPSKWTNSPWRHVFFCPPWPCWEVLRQIRPPLPFLFLPAEMPGGPGQLHSMHFKGLEEVTNNLNGPPCLLLLI